MSDIQLAAIRAGLRAAGQHYTDEMLGKVQDDIDTLRAERNAAREEVEKMRWALLFYANPETYHAINFYAEPPCGAFRKDFDQDHGHRGYDRPMPGKRARAALQEGEAARATQAPSEGGKG